MRVGTVLLAVLVICALIVAFYLGQNFTPGSKEQPTLIVKSKHTVQAVLLDNSRPEVQPWVETVSWSPRVFVYHNFLSAQECEDLVTLANKDVTRSEVVGVTGKPESNTARTSSGVFLTEKYMRASPLLRDIERRLAKWSNIPVENGEAYYLLKYEQGQEYKPHTDWFSDDDAGRVHIGTQGNRMATVLTYLHTPDEGGATIFPRSNIEVPAKAGDAVLFFDLDPANMPDEMSLHGGKPVVKGVKWALTKWIRENKASYRWEDYLTDNDKHLLQKEDEEFQRARAAPKSLQL